MLVPADCDSGHTNHWSDLIGWNHPGHSYELLPFGFRHRAWGYPAVMSQWSVPAEQSVTGWSVGYSGINIHAIPLGLNLRVTSVHKTVWHDRSRRACAQPGIRPSPGHALQDLAVS